MAIYVILGSFAFIADAKYDGILQEVDAANVNLCNLQASTCFEIGYQFSTLLGIREFYEVLLYQFGILYFKF